jgi:hypothetical protein
MHGKEPPQHVVELETHRHRGIDLHLITQHPMLADPSVRRLTDRHLHVVRTFGMEKCTIHEWPQVRENCEKPAGRADSIKHPSNYPVEVFNWYKSAEVHTMKRRIPMKLYVMLACPVILAVLVYFLYGSIMKRVKGEDLAHLNQGQKVTAVNPQTGTGYMPLPEKANYQNAVEDAKQYAFARAPRVAGLTHTAPIYDKITEPTAAPLPVACVQSGRRCKCYSQQGTPMSVEFNLCAEIAQNGYFQDFNPNGKVSDRADRAEAASKLLSDQQRLPISGANTSDRSIVLGDGRGYGVVGGRYDGIRNPGVESQTTNSKASLAKS